MFIMYFIGSDGSGKSNVIKNPISRIRCHHTKRLNHGNVIQPINFAKLDFPHTFKRAYGE